jgi:hypothetical protein
MHKRFTLLLLVCSLTCFSQENSKPSVLLLSTFHMKYTPDMRKLAFNPADPKRKAEIEILNEKLLKFSPTVICIERTPETQNEIDKDYQNYLKGKQPEQQGEDILVGFAIGKKLGLERIYGIDHKLEYDYQSVMNLADSSKNTRYYDYMHANLSTLNLFKPGVIDTKTTLEVLIELNTEKVLSELYNLNAGIFTYVNSEKGFEGADVASDYYKRNLRIFANLNKLPIKKSDRVLVIMGGSHIAFLQDFISKSPVYSLVNTVQVLQK